MPAKKQPMQPIEVAADGVVRFRANAVVKWLVDTGRIDLNEIGRQGFPLEDTMQFDQLTGYSVSGFGDTGADPAVVAEADRIAAFVVLDDPQ